MRDDAIIDGVAADGAWLDERSCQFGDGLFETIAVVDGVPCLWSAHMARLEAGCRRLRLPLPDPQQLLSECARLCEGRARAVVKIFWTAGLSVRGYRRSEPLRPRRILRRFDWPDAASGATWSVRLCEHRLGENPATAGIKHLNRLDQVIARAEWDDPGLQEGLMQGQDSRVVCGTMSNLFVQRGERLQTPEIAGAGIAGVVRDLVLRLGRNHHREVAEVRLSVDDVRAADALYLTNSLIGVVRVLTFGADRYDAAIAEHPLMVAARSGYLLHEPGGAGR